MLLEIAGTHKQTREFNLFEGLVDLSKLVSLRKDFSLRFKEVQEGKLVSYCEYRI